MSLQGFSSRSIQALTNKLQAFGGVSTPPIYKPYGISVYNDIVYVVDVEEKKLKTYQTDGTKIDETVLLDFTPTLPPPLSSNPVNVSSGDKLFVDGNYIVVGKKDYPNIYDMSKVFDFGISKTICQAYENEEFFIFTNRTTVSAYDFSGLNVRNWSIGYQSFGTPIYVNSGYVYIITNRLRTFGQPVTSMIKYNISGTFIDSFDYWEIPGFPDPPDKIGRFKLHVSGSVSYSVDYGSKIIYTNSTSTGAQIDTFTLPEYVGDLFFYNSELYVTYVNTGKVAVVDPTDGTLIRDWTAS